MTGSAATLAVRDEDTTLPLQEVAAPDHDYSFGNVQLHDHDDVDGSEKACGQTAAGKHRRNYLWPLLKKKSKEKIKEASLDSVSSKKSWNCCGTKTMLFYGVLSLFLGIFSFIWTPLDIMLFERIHMTPGLPAYDWWLSPPDSVYFKIYLFNLTNAEAFMNGNDTELAFEEVGPIVFKEILRHSNTTFNPNSTLTYVAKRWLEFQPELNEHIDLNATLTVVNIPYLGAAALVNEYSLFFRAPFTALASKSQPIVKKTIYEYLWNFTDPVLINGNKILPGLVPITNVGMLATMYMDFTDTVNVYIGSRWGDEKFFTLDKFHGSESLPGHKTCPDTVKGSTEGILYHQRLKKNSSLLYWRKTLCRVVKLDYEKEETINNVKAFKFVVPNTTYHRITGEQDCYAGKPPLADGLSDVSKCFFNFPMAMSLPHFYGIDPKVFDKIRGLHPDPEKHGSYAIVEPITGIPLDSCARSQSNLILNSLDNFYKVKKFGRMVVPMFWAEYSQHSLPSYVWIMVKLTVVWMPIIQVLLSCSLTLLGVILTYCVCRKLFCLSPSLTNVQHRFTKKAILAYDNNYVLDSKK